MIKEFVTWLVSKVPGLTIGGNVQVGFRAVDAPVRCHVLVETGGPADFDLPYRKDMMLQVLSRAADYQAVRADAWAIYTAIEGTKGWTIGPLVSGGQAYRVWSIGALAKPQYLGQDAKGSHEFSTNYLITASPI
ncbi:MAG: minor capsid protein [Sphaerochaeta sp.]|jgi:hypothetical protein|nr:minor capsid protein [Sphaerochaeta sp.]